MARGTSVARGPAPEAADAERVGRVHASDARENPSAEDALMTRPPVPALSRQKDQQVGAPRWPPHIAPGDDVALFVGERERMMVAAYEPACSSDSANARVHSRRRRRSQVCPKRPANSARAPRRGLLERRNDRDDRDGLGSASTARAY